MIVNANPKSDAQWYFEEFSGDRERLYDIFFDTVSYTHLTLPTT